MQVLRSRNLWWKMAKGSCVNCFKTGAAQSLGARARIADTELEMQGLGGTLISLSSRASSQWLHRKTLLWAR